MEVVEGYFYHMKDCFFDDVLDDKLMRNKEDGHYRPHCLAIRDRHNDGIIWMVPVSTKVQKYRIHYDKQVRRYGRCTKIVLAQCGGVDAAYLIQNAFPTIPYYLDHIHIKDGCPVASHKGTMNEVARCLRGNLSLHRRGAKLFFTDIDAIYKTMIDKLADEQVMQDS